MECDRQTKELQARREKIVAMREATSAASSSTPASKKKGHKKQDSTDSLAERRAQAALAAVDEQLQSAGADGVARVSASVLRQLLINYLNAAVVTGNDKTFLTSRQYDLCTWLAQDRDAEVARRRTEEKKEDVSIAALALDISPQFERDLDACQLNWDPPAASTAAASVAAAGSAAAAAPSAAAKCILITHDVAVNMSRQLSWDRAQSVLKYHNRIIDSLCARCFDPAPGCRKAAVDSLADLIRVDPQMLNDKRIKGALQKRLEDSSIRTREAVVDLLGAHMFQSQQAQAMQQQQQQQQLSASASNGHAAAAAAPVAPALPFDPSSEYFNFILGRLNDVGISVRKKVRRGGAACKLLLRFVRVLTILLFLLWLLGCEHPSEALPSVQSASAIHRTLRGPFAHSPRLSLLILEELFPHCVSVLCHVCRNSSCAFVTARSPCNRWPS